MKVGDRVQTPGAVHAVAKVGGFACGSDGGCRTACGKGAAVWFGDTLLPPDTPVTCKRCRKAMEKGQANG